MKPLVYLADLRHNHAGVLTSDCMPLGISCIKAVMDRDVPQVESRMFAYPGRLWDAIHEQPPDVLMTSNYLSNEELGFFFARMVKSLNPNALVVMGGPNMPIEDHRQIEYVRARPELDLYLSGEGDFLASEITRAYLDCGMSVEKMGERDIPSCIHRRRDGEIVLSEARPRSRALDDIPSPFLTGIQDEFFDGKLVPMIETNRGCPFTCTFCVQGTDWYARVNYFSLDRIREELGYIARRLQTACPHMRKCSASQTPTMGCLSVT